MEELQEALRGVAFTTPTPFTEDGASVKYDEVERHVEWLESAGADVFVPCGNTGEYYSLTDEERIGVVGRTVDATGSDATVLGGVGGSLEHAKELADAYAEAGADALLVMDLDHTYRHTEGMKAYYRRLAEATDLGLVLYKRSGALSLDVVSAVAPIENVVGLKFAVNDVEAFSRAVDRFSEELVLTTGIAERFAPAFALEGASGFTTGIGSFAPHASLALMAAIREANWDRAREIRDVIRPFERLREGTGPNNDLSAANNVPAVKYAMELAGLYGGPVRPPIVDLSEEDRERARTAYQAIDAIDPSV